MWIGVVYEFELTVSMDYWSIVWPWVRHLCLFCWRSPNLFGYICFTPGGEWTLAGLRLDEGVGLRLGEG